MDALSQHVQHQLKRHYHKPKYMGFDIIVPCPFHADNNPSMSICIETHGKKQAGIYNCWSPKCGASGSWNKLAERLGLDKYVYLPLWDRPVDIAETQTSEYSCSYRLEDLPAAYKWKRSPTSLNYSTLERFDAKLTKHFDRRYLYLPCSMLGETCGHVLALQGKRELGVQKYMNSTGAWPSRSWFGWDQARMLSTSYVFLVEGPADAMMMHQNNISAIALLGNTWSSEKAKWLCLNYSTVYLCFDGDDAGRAYGKTIKHDLRSSNLNVKRISLPDGSDPASLDKYTYKCIRDLLS